MTPVLSFDNATLGFGSRILWSGLSLQIEPGEFVAILGPNGSGKTSLLKVILGQQALTAGTLMFDGGPVTRGNGRIGYIPQQKLFDGGTPLRARDLLALGLDGTRWGTGWPSARKRDRIDELLESVGATAFALAPIATLSGGEQQRLRVGQAIAGNPALLLCDEPLLSLDLNNQRVVSELINAHRLSRDAAVLFVTHDVNPVLDMVDRVIYLVDGQFRIGAPNEVLTTEVLSELYGTPVDVFRSRGRIVVVGTPDAHEHDHHSTQDARHHSVATNRASK
jgi:zinc/manganese transport system ATP-binding protein